ncbi:MAG: DUF4325 domain-containing protein [Blautia sp.]|nr:DUF4325 domain-containing protein [Blautia sp.]
MKLSREKKAAMDQYALEIIDKQYDNIPQYISEVFKVDRSTAFRCISRLLQENRIIREKRGRYTLVKEKWDYVLDRGKGDLNSDIGAFEHYLLSHIQSFPQNVVQIWSYVFSEMINNVMDHSGSETAIVSIRQDCLKTKVFIIDQGVGIFEKIKAYFGFSSVEESIEELFKGKLTTDKENHSGEGIYFSSRLMDSFAIISSGKIFTCNHFDEEEILNLKKEHDVPGTCVYMNLANNSAKTAKEIFDHFSDEEGGFIRTMIPMKNMFDSAPVSRSQAKRLSHRFEEFKEVILDFEGIDWIGQGFADQLFRVFVNAHPEIKILPENMNAEVRKMVQHVKN